MCRRERRTVDKIPPPPQQVAVLGSEGELSLPWNLWLTQFIKTLQNVGDGLDALGLYGSGSGGGVASSGAGPAVDLSDQASAEGRSNLGARADHLHLKLIGAETDGVTWGSVSALNVVTPGLEVVYEPNLTGSLLTGHLAYYPFDEAAGSGRVCRIGSWPTLAETGGTVATAAGKFGTAISCAYSDTSYLHGTFTPRNFNNGFTMAAWIWMDGTPPAKPGRLFSVSNSAGNDWMETSRYYNGDGLEWLFRSPGGVSTQACIPTLPSQGAWWLVFWWWDNVNKVAQMEIAGDPRYGGYIFNTPGTSVDITGWTFDTLDVFGVPSGAINEFNGRADSLMVWERMLTVAERERLRVNFRSSVGVNWAALELFGG